MTAPVVGFAGLSHLAIVSAAATAGRGFTVVVYGPDQSLVARLGRRELPVFEPGLDELMAEHADRLSFTTDAAALAGCDVVYVAQDVPTADDGTADLEPVRLLAATVTAHLGRDAALVVLSQVPPGFTRSLPLAAPQRYYQVETLVFGRAVERAMHPERFIVGCDDPARPLPDALAEVLAAFDCPVLPMRYESAELAKISINLFLVSSVATTNTLADLCERVGADWREIAPALRLDRRIGPHAYLTPGLGVAGGNLERDVATTMRLAAEHGAATWVPAAWLRSSAYRRDWALRRVHERVLAASDAPVLALWGLAYKENTASTVNSPALALLDAVRPFEVRAHDPEVTAQAAWHPRLTQASEPLATCTDADALVVMTPWPQYRAIDPADVRRHLRGDVVIDPFAMLDPIRCAAAGLEHHVLGAPGRSEGDTSC